MNRGIDEPTIERNEIGEITRTYIRFGPHDFIDIMPHEETGEPAVYIGATHHGFGAHAHEVGGELEQIVEEVMKNHPDISF